MGWHGQSPGVRVIYIRWHPVALMINGIRCVWPFTVHLLQMIVGSTLCDHGLLCMPIAQTQVILSTNIMTLMASLMVHKSQRNRKLMPVYVRGKVAVVHFRLSGISRNDNATLCCCSIILFHGTTHSGPGELRITGVLAMQLLRNHQSFVVWYYTVTSVHNSH